MKDIKDYLHLYLGCEVKCYNSFGRLIHFGISGGVVEFVIWTEHYKADEIKPLLRPLSSMTEEEWNDIEQWKIYQGDMVETFALIAAECTKYLLSKHFDLFGLIDASLAIDKTALKELK